MATLWIVMRTLILKVLSQLAAVLRMKRARIWKLGCPILAGRLNLNPVQGQSRSQNPNPNPNLGLTSIRSG